ncbi:hypothetical protein V2W45_1411706 [Cenococcum geophilum]
MTSPAPRPYKRISAKEWEKQKNHIYALYIGEDRALEDVIEIMRVNHQFEANEKAYKRRIKKWGISKNIPKSDMMKLAKKAKKRMDQAGKKTRFERRGNDGQFHKVPTEKLDVFQKRFGTRATSALSPSSSIPSNLLYKTPSNMAGSSSTESDLDGQEGYDKFKANEFNHEFERIWSSKSKAEFWKPFGRQENAIASDEAGWSVGPYNIHDTHTHLDGGHASLFEGDYEASITSLELAKMGYAHVIGDMHWLTIAAGHEAEMVKLVTFDVNPRELNQRIRQLLFRHHTILRQNYSRGLGVGSLEELKKHLISLKIVSDFWTTVLVAQMAIKKWLFLGTSHRAIVGLRSAIDELRAKWQQSIEIEPPEVDLSGIGNAFASMMTLGDLKIEKRGASFLDLCDKGQDVLRQKLDALHSNDGSMAHVVIWNEVEKLYASRRKTYSGAYYSFLGDFKAAEYFFRKGQETLGLENSPEIKLQRLLWHAEHKTRTQDWRGAQILLDQAQQVFDTSWRDSEFINNHFAERRELVSISIKERISIDKVVYRNEMKQLDGLRREGELPSSADTPISTHSDWVYPPQIVDLERFMFGRSMFSVSPLPSGMRGEHGWGGEPPPLSHSPVAGASPMQPSTPVNAPNDGLVLPPMDPGEKGQDQQRTAEGETPDALIVQSPSGSPSGNDSRMELYD